MRHNGDGGYCDIYVWINNQNRDIFSLSLYGENIHVIRATVLTGVGTLDLQSDYLFTARQNTITGNAIAVNILRIVGLMS